MNTNVVMHHESRAWSCDGRTDFGMNASTPSWPDVTCGECRLEQPPTNVPGQVEYRVPADVLGRDTSLAEGDSLVFAAAREELLRKRLAKLDALQETAVDLVAHWSRTLAEVTALRESTVRALRATQAVEKRTVVGPPTSKGSAHVNCPHDPRSDGDPGSAMICSRLLLAEEEAFGVRPVDFTKGARSKPNAEVEK